MPLAPPPPGFEEADAATQEDLRSRGIRFGL